MPSLFLNKMDLDEWRDHAFRLHLLVQGETKQHAEALDLYHSRQAEKWRELPALIEAKMRRTPVDIDVLARIGQSMQNYYSFDHNLDLPDTLLFVSVKTCFLEYERDCIRCRRTFAMCLKRMHLPRDIVWLLVWYLMNTEEQWKRLRDTVLFCKRQFVYRNRKTFDASEEFKDFIGNLSKQLEKDKL